MKKKRHNTALTDRERDCLLLIAQGMCSDAIADHLGISTAGTNFHIQNMTKKLSVKNRAHAVAVAIADGLIPANAARRGESQPQMDAEEHASLETSDDDET